MSISHEKMLSRQRTGDCFVSVKKGGNKIIINSPQLSAQRFCDTVISCENHKLCTQSPTPQIGQQVYFSTVEVHCKHIFTKPHSFG